MNGLNGGLFLIVIFQNIEPPKWKEQNWIETKQKEWKEKIYKISENFSHPSKVKSTNETVYLREEQLKERTVHHLESVCLKAFRWFTNSVIHIQLTQLQVNVKSMFKESMFRESKICLTKNPFDELRVGWHENNCSFGLSSS